MMVGPKPGEEGEGGDPDSALKITKAVIKEGKHYTAAQLGLAATAAVTGDSVFTTAFSLKYGKPAASRQGKPCS
ncbi:MAG: hypothetical protein RQM92_00565 [Candidatus Syntrophopropionicum ammoniitolerans]